MKRNLMADLELCSRATPGPWLETEESNTEVFVKNTQGEPVLFELYYDGSHTAIKHEDMEFMIQAREGWPHAIERAIKVEALVWELTEALECANEFFQALGQVKATQKLLDANTLVTLALHKAKEVPGDV